MVNFWLNLRGALSYRQ